MIYYIIMASLYYNLVLQLLVHCYCIMICCYNYNHKCNKEYYSNNNNYNNNSVAIIISSVSGNNVLTALITRKTIIQEKREIRQSGWITSQ